MNNIFLNDPYLFEYFVVVLVLLLLFGAAVFLKIEKFKNWLGIGLLIAPVIYFFLTLDALILNIPLTDDYNLLETIYKFKNESNFISAIKILFEQVNQHRFAFERIIMLIMVFFTGTVNIKFQIMLGNLFMLGILYLFFLTFKKERISWFYFIPVPYVLFNLVYYENAFWGIAALQNTPLIFFAFLSSYGVSRQDKNSWTLGALAALITTFVSGSGLLTWIVGAIILTLQKRYKLLAYWLVIAVGVFLFYFLFDYYFITAEGEKVWKHPIFNTIFLLGFWGNALYLDAPHPLVPIFYKDMVLCVFLGIGIGVLFFTWLLRIVIFKKSQWNNWFLLGAFMFVMGTGAMFVISRPINNFLMYGGSIFSRRYMIFGVVLLATAYLVLIIVTKNYRSVNRIAVGLGLISFISLNFFSYYSSITQIRKQYEDLALDAFYWENYSTFLTTGNHFGDVPFWNHPTRMKDLIIGLEASGLSKIHASNQFPEFRQVLLKTENKKEIYKGKLDVSVDYRHDGFNNLVKHLTFQTEKDSGLLPSYFILSSKDHTIILPALPIANSLMSFLTTRTYYDKVFQYPLFRTKLPAGKYDIWIMSVKNTAAGKWESRNTRKKVFLF